MDRGIREVCNEAIHLLYEHDPGDMVHPSDFVGFFEEILSILNETENDLK